MLTELGADLGGNFEGKRTRCLIVVSLLPQVGRYDLQQLLVASRGVAAFVILDVGCRQIYVRSCRCCACENRSASEPAGLTLGGDREVQKCYSTTLPVP